MKFIKNLFKKRIPKEGSFYTYKNKNSCYDGWSGIVFHHLGGDRYGIEKVDGNGILCNIKP